MENLLLQKMHQWTIQEQTEVQYLKGDQIDRPLKLCRHSIDFYYFSRESLGWFS